MTEPNLPVAEAVRLHGTETRLPIAERGMVSYNVLDRRGRIVGVVSYTVTVLRGK